MIPLPLGVRAAALRVVREKTPTVVRDADARGAAPHPAPTVRPFPCLYEAHLCPYPAPDVVPYAMHRRRGLSLVYMKPYLFPYLAPYPILSPLSYLDNEAFLLLI